FPAMQDAGLQCGARCCPPAGWSSLKLFRITNVLLPDQLGAAKMASYQLSPAGKFGGTCQPEGHITHSRPRATEAFKFYASAVSVHNISKPADHYHHPRKA